MSFASIFSSGLVVFSYYVFLYMLFMGTNLLSLSFVSNDCSPRCGSPLHFHPGVCFLVFFDEQKFLILSDIPVFSFVVHPRFCKLRPLGWVRPQPVFVNKVLWGPRHAQTFMFAATFPLRRQSWARETTGPRRPKIHTVCPFQETFANLCLSQGHKDHLLP